MGSFKPSFFWQASVNLDYPAILNDVLVFPLLFNPSLDPFVHGRSHDTVELLIRINHCLFNRLWISIENIRDCDARIPRNSRTNVFTAADFQVWFESDAGFEDVGTESIKELRSLRSLTSKNPHRFANKRLGAYHGQAIGMIISPPSSRGNVNHVYPGSL